ncbi:glycosyltransferase family 32 protein [Devosia riboflavina]|uniref:glycosyltransferase family 32 protein n=1 Tax=Devosia riboflavina TaxID=46914 RepID=UPI0006907905|nr:glycosyltransferase [Devosia riboflavina]
MIPKILHFTWKSEQLPRQMQAYYDAWRRLHPDWDIRLWTDETMRAFVAETYPAVVATYDAYPKMIQRADSFRYLVLGAMGGVYADLDVEPFQSIDGLLNYECFLGIEPLEHIFPDRHHQGVPFLLTNAFMGSVPGHRLWQDIVARMPDLVDQETFYSTGPSMVTASVLRLQKEDRPTLLSPMVWSPLLADGRKTRSDAEAIALLEPIGTVVPATSGSLVSHVWMTTWVPWHKRGNRFAPILQVPTAIKWAWRQIANPAVAKVVISDPLQLYTNQVIVPAEERPQVQVAVRLGKRDLSPALSEALAALDYPRDRLTFAVHISAEANRGDVAAMLERSGLQAEIVSGDFASSAARDNAILDGFAADKDYLLLVDGDVTAIPADAIQRMLGAGLPVTAANVVDETGAPGDDQLFRYEKAAPFKVLYKDGGRDGVVRRNKGFRTYLGHQKVFSLLPLDGVGESFVLIARAVIDASVRFAETPYKLHLGAEAFGIMARDKGFEAGGLTNLKVVRQRSS